jgi:hypothetical protein
MATGMILYSVTVNVETPFSDEWLEWMLAEHIPAVMRTQAFVSFQINELLDPIHDEHSISFNIQYLSPNVETLEDYRLNHAPVLQAQHQEKFGHCTLAFRTILAVLKPH